MFSQGPLVYAKTEEFESRAALLGRLADSIPAMLAYWDRDQHCRFANRAYEKWFGVTPTSLLGKHLSELLGPIYELNRPYIEGALRGIPQSFDREIPDPAGGPARFSHADYTPDVVDGEVRGFFVVVSDISDHKQLEEDLRVAREVADLRATHDPLTGLANRPLIEDTISRAIALADRKCHRCAVLYLDMDHFKLINDSFGHAAGDEVLCQIARRLEDGLRRSDTVGRLGGDEFVIVVPEVETSEQAVAVVSKLLQAVATEPMAVAGRLVRVTFSVGLALYPDHGATAQELIARADGALYEAKRAGRNTYAMAVG